MKRLALALASLLIAGAAQAGNVDRYSPAGDQACQATGTPVAICFFENSPEAEARKWVDYRINLCARWMETYVGLPLVDDEFFTAKMNDCIKTRSYIKKRWGI